MKLLTVTTEKIYEFVEIESYHIKSADINIPVLKVGEKGRGRREEILPVKLTHQNQKEWEAGMTVKIQYGYLSKTKSNKPKIVETQSDTTNIDKVFLKMIPSIGFRGTNLIEFMIKDKNPDILGEGKIAQGEAGRMGQGEQIFVVVEYGDIFKVSRTGRLYGNPPVRIGQINENKNLYLTPEEWDLYKNL